MTAHQFGLFVKPRRPEEAAPPSPPSGVSSDARAVAQLLLDAHLGLRRAAVERVLNDELERRGLRLAPAGLRAAVHELRLAGMLIGSHPQNGYWLIENDEERRLTVRQLASRVRHQAAAIRALDKAYGDRLQAALDFPVEG